MYAMRSRSSRQCWRGLWGLAYYRVIMGTPTDFSETELDDIQISQQFVAKAPKNKSP